MASKAPIEPTLEQYASYQSVYNYFNETLFDNSLKPCLLNFSRRAISGVYFRPLHWKNEKQKIHEICLNPDVLERSFADSMALLVKGMGFQWLHEQGTPPSVVGYCSKELSMKMESIGITLSDTGEMDGKRTGLWLKHSVAEDGPFDEAFKAMPEEYKLPWVSGAQPLKTQRKNDKLKYSCPECDAAAWGKAGLAIACGCTQGNGAKWVCDFEAEVA